MAELGCSVLGGHGVAQHWSRFQNEAGTAVGGPGLMDGPVELGVVAPLEPSGDKPTYRLMGSAARG